MGARLQDLDLDTVKNIRFFIKDRSRQAKINIRHCPT
jgi:hypothetical protein